MQGITHLWIGGLSALAVATGALRIGAEEPVEILTREIHRAEDERDRARKDLLRVQSDSREAMQALDRERRTLSERLDRKSQEALRLEAAVRDSTRDAERARAELERKDRALRKLEGDRLWTQKKYEQVLERVEALSDSAESGDVDVLTRQRDRLRGQLREASERIKDLREGRGAIAGEEQTLRDKARALGKSLDAARRAESLANAKVAALESRLDYLRDELAQQFEERSLLEQENRRQQRDLEKLRSELSRAMENRVPRDEVAPLREQLEQTSSANRRLRDELAAAREIPDLRDDLALVERERDLLSGQKKRLDGQLERTAKNLKKERKARQRLTHENKTLREKFREERARGREMEKDISSLRSAIDQAEASGIDANDLVDARRLLEDMRQENRELKAELDAQRGSVDNLMRELTDKENTRDRQLRDLQRMLGEQVSELAEANKRIAHLERVENELDLVREQRSTLVQRQHATHRDMKVLARHIHDLRAKVKAGEVVEADLAREQRRSRGLTLTIRDLRRELANLEGVAELVAREKRENEAQVKDLRLQLRRREARQRALEAEKLALERELRRARRE